MSNTVRPVGQDSPVAGAAEANPVKVSAVGDPSAPTENDYDKAVVGIPADHVGFGSGKLGLYELKFGPFIFNPFVSIVGAAMLWGFTALLIVDPSAVGTLNSWKAWVTATFSWFYIATQNIWIIFMVVVLYYYGDKRLGKDDEKPEFDNATYFSMLFSAGVAVGLFVYGTAEPLYHYDYWLANRWNSDPTMIDNDKANYAILLTLFHWGFHGWVPYALVGVQLGIMSYRHGLPLLMRTAFYPLLGKHTWGWIGDVIDGFTIVTVVSGICTSLGLGVWQITVGMAGLSWLPEDCDGDCYRDVYLAIIWGITCIATLSVLSGLGNGIKTLSQISLFAACFILGVTFFLGDTWFYMNSLTQCVGYYAQYSMTQLGWHVDAFAQQAWGSGGTPDMEGAPKAVTGGSFMDGWTIFYWGWWIAWCPFVGTFIARISRGRTVKEVIVYSLGGPLITSMLWFGIFGAMAIGMENNSQLLWQAGTDLYNDPSTFQTGQHGIPQAEFLGSYLGGAIDSRETTGGFGTSNGRCSGWAIPAKTNSSCVMDSVLGVYLNNGQACRPYCGDRFSVNHPQCIPQGAVEGVSKACGACFVQQPNFDRNGMTGCQIFEANPKNMGLPCPKYIKYWSANVAMSPVCLFTDWDQEASWYNTMAQFGPLLGYFFNVVSILSLLLFFVTSSDSGSLVVDTIAANGRDESSVIQRIFWAFTEGGLATGLVLGAEVGAEKSVLKALQAASICTGLPYTCLLCFLMPAIWLGFELETHMKRKTFKTPIFGGIFDLVDVVFSRGKCPVPVSQTKNFFLFLICPFIGAYQLTANKGRIYNYTVTLVSAGLFAAWIVLLAVSTPINGLWGMGWMMYLCLGFILANARREVRNDKGIYGNVAEDVAACVFMYPNAMVQAVEALEEPDSKDKGL